MNALLLMALLSGLPGKATTVNTALITKPGGKPTHLDTVGTVYAATANVSMVASGDFNMDGHNDIATVSSSGAKLNVFINKGDGTFFNKVEYTTEATPQALTVGDFNNDGKLDILVTGYNGKLVSRFLGVGDGTFGAKADIITPSTRPTGIASGFLNADSNLDFVTTQDSSRLGVYLGAGNGTFASEVYYATNAGSSGPRIVDINNDGKMDVVVNNGTYISVFTGVGDGTLNAKVDYTHAGANFTMARAFDTNNDGWIDLIGCDYNGYIWVFLNNGDGTFAAATGYSNGNAVSAAFGDFNYDGRMDIAVGDNTSHPSIMYGTPTGFAAYFRIGTVNGGYLLVDHFKSNSTWDLVQGTGSNLVVFLSVK